MIKMVCTSDFSFVDRQVAEKRHHDYGNWFGIQLILAIMPFPSIHLTVWMSWVLSFSCNHLFQCRWLFPLNLKPMPIEKRLRIFSWIWKKLPRFASSKSHFSLLNMDCIRDLLRLMDDETGDPFRLVSNWRKSSLRSMKLKWNFKNIFGEYASSKILIFNKWSQLGFGPVARPIHRYVLIAWIFGKFF